MLKRVPFIANHLSRTRPPIRLVKMSTFTLKDSSVEVELTEGLTKDELLEFPAFKACAQYSDDAPKSVEDLSSTTFQLDDVHDRT